MNTIAELIDLITLKPINETTFTGENYKAPWGRVFGGQVVSQALYAAYQTVPEDRIAHSLHSYFILGGDLEVPITYEVEVIRDGGSFTTRRVVAKQHGEAIFIMAASFQRMQDGVNHNISMPNVLQPEHLETIASQLAPLKETNRKLYDGIIMTHPKVFEYRPVEHVLSKFMKDGAPINNQWIKTTQPVTNSTIALQQQLLAYASDYNLLGTASLPHREHLNTKKVLYISLDHAIWFHRPFDISNWLLYAMDGPSASNSRGFARGNIFNVSGDLVASVVQEGLLREMK